MNCSPSLRDSASACHYLPLTEHSRFLPVTSDVATVASRLYASPPLSPSHALTNLESVQMESNDIWNTNKIFKKL